MCGCKNSSLTKRVERLNEKREVVTRYCSVAQAALYHKVKKGTLYSACQKGAKVNGCIFRYQTQIKKKRKVLSEQNSRILRRLESSDIICRGEKCGCRSGKSKSTVLAFVRSNQIETNSSMAPLSSSLASSSLTTVSDSGSQFKARPRALETYPRCPGVMDRCPVSAGVMQGFLDFMQSRKFRTWFSEW